MSKFLVTKKHYSDSNAKFIVGKLVLEIDDINKQRFSAIKKHFKTFIDIAFDSCGGNNIEGITLALGDTFSDLPTPTKSQHIFLGWFTSASGGTLITSETLVSLDINTLYALWEYVLIASDCTSYSVTTTSSYKNTGIYTASIADSSQPIYIDWGDGTVEKLTSSISLKSYTYKTVGNFTVKISDNITSFAPSYNNSTWYRTTSQNRNTFKGMLTTGSKVISLPTYAFYYCLEMTNIDFMQTCWPTVTSLPDYCFYYCSGLTSILGVKRFTSLGLHCFNYCKGLTGVLDLSEFKFTTLSNTYTFANCTNVTQWILPSGFTGTSFGNYMFVNNSKLNGVGNSEKTTQLLNVTEIEFLEYTALSNSYIDTQILPTTVGKWEIDILIISSSGKSRFLGCYANDNNDALLALATPDGSKSYYPFKYGSNWNDTSMNIDITLRHAIKYEFQPNSQNIYVDNILKVSSTYDAWTNNENNTIRLFCIKNNEYYARTLRIFACKLYNNTSLVRDFIPARVGNIGYMYDKVSGQLFGNSGSGSFIIGPDKANTEEIIVEQEIITSKLPESLTSTGTYAFLNCSNLNNIIIPSKVLSIGTYAFYGCTSLNNVNIEATNLTAINRYAFYNCNKLTDLDLPDTVKTIGNYAFYGCTSLNYAGRKVEIEIPDEPVVDYLCFIAEQANSTIKMSKVGSAPTVYLETSPTGEEGSWSDFIVDSTTITLANVGDKVYFRAKLDNERFINENYEYNYFVMTGKIAASGNLNTLLKADGSIVNLTGRDHCYYYMFQDCTSLTQAPELPATTLAENCYDHMFSGCTSLTQAPELPATTLANNCYYSMFNGCTSLIQAPTLPATSLADWCYAFMFADCKSLTQAPELPAIDLTDCCYHFMFSCCTSLAQAPELSAETLAGGCYAEMFISCKSPFTFSDKTFDEMIDLIQYEYIIGSSSWYNENEEPNNPIEIICSDKIMLATFDENEYTWTLTEK